MERKWPKAANEPRGGGTAETAFVSAVRQGTTGPLARPDGDPVLARPGRAIVAHPDEVGAWREGRGDPGVVAEPAVVVLGHHAALVVGAGERHDHVGGAVRLEGIARRRGRPEPVEVGLAVPADGRAERRVAELEL